MFYLYQLERKDKTEYNGIESFVDECRSLEDLRWFPQGMAILLNSSSSVSEEDQSKSKIEQTKAQFSNTLTRVQKIQAVQKRR